MIVGITGRAGAGKDTVANILIHKRRFATMQFAGPLKRMLCDLLRVPFEAWEDREWKETVIPELGVSPRVMAQTLGTEWGRNCCGEDFWVKIGMHNAKSIEAELEKIDDRYTICFTDVRFENEAGAIRNLGGYIIHVHRPGHEAGTSSAHSSEDGIQVNPLSDIVIINDGTLEDLERETLELIDSRTLKEANEKVQDRSAGSARN